MKKSLFVLGVAVAALASCTQSEVLDIAESNVIKFDNAFVGNTTKATVEQINTDGIEHFYVMGTKGGSSFFNNEKVYKKNDLWGYDDLKKWEAGTYAFAAYSNGGTTTQDGKIDSGVTFSSTDGLQISYTVDNDDKRDLIMAYSTTDINATNAPIEFTFKHALAMIKFTLKSNLGDNEVSISNFVVKSINNQGTATIKDDGVVAWTNQTGTENFGSVDFTTTQATAGESDELVVVPQSGNSLSVEFTAKVTADQGEITKNLKATITTYDWQPGYRYNYTATITGTDMEVIEFSAPTVTEWGGYTDIDAGDLTI